MFRTRVLPWCNLMPATVDSASAKLVVQKSYSIWLAHQVDVVEESAQMLTSLDDLDTSSRAPWHQRVTLLPAFCLGDCPPFAGIVVPTVGGGLTVGQPYKRKQRLRLHHPHQPAQHGRPWNVIERSDSIDEWLWDWHPWQHGKGVQHNPCRLESTKRIGTVRIPPRNASCTVWPELSRQDVATSIQWQCLALRHLSSKARSTVHSSKQMRWNLGLSPVPGWWLPRTKVQECLP